MSIPQLPTTLTKPLAVLGIWQNNTTFVLLDKTYYTHPMHTLTTEQLEEILFLVKSVPMTDVDITEKVLRNIKMIGSLLQDGK